MKSFLSYSVFPLLILLVLTIGGCKPAITNTTEPNTDPLKLVNATGQISGRLINNFTNSPIAGAIVTISYNSQNAKVVTDETGHFIFSGIPITEYQGESGSLVSSGSYPVTFSLADINKKQTDTTKKYRDYYYQTVDVKFTSVDTLMITNMVASIDMMINYCNTTINGIVVDNTNAPAANAIVYLYDQSISNALIAQTVTDANGKYTFNKVDNGIIIYMKAKSADGLMQAALNASYMLDPRITVYNFRNEVASERLVLNSADNNHPYVVSVSPEYNSDIQFSNNFGIVYNFSEPILQNQYTRTGMPKGLSSMIDDITFTYDGLKKTAGDVGLRLTWNPSFTILTIFPTDVLTTGRYTLDFTKVLAKLKDNANNIIIDNANISGDLSESLKFTISQNLVTTAVPQLFTTSTVNYSGGTVNLQWSAYSDPNVSYFNVYKSTDGQPFQLAGSKVQSLGYTDAVGTLIYPSLTNPLRSFSVKYKVTAVSKDLIEGTESNVLEIADKTQPGTSVDTSFQIISSSGSTQDTTTYTISLPLNEPIDPTLASSIDQFSFENITGYTFNKVSANYLGYVSGNYVVQLTFTTNKKLLSTAIFRITCSGMKDLSGNIILTNKNAFKCRGYF